MDENVVISNIKGGFGNQLFQYATGLAISMKYDSKYKLDLSFFNQPEYRSAFRLDMLAIDYKIADEPEILKLKNAVGEISFYSKILSQFAIHNDFNKKTHIIDEPGFKPSMKTLRASPPIYIEGWCVKEMYFRDIRGTLIKTFAPKSEITKEALTILNSIKSTNSVSIHVRRGDYVNNEVSKSYLLNIIKNALMRCLKLSKSRYFLFFQMILHGAWIT